MKRSALALAGILALTTATQAATPQRLRGHVSAISATSLTILTNSGTSETVTLDNSTKIAAAAPATLNDIQPGDFIGTGAMTDGDHLNAMEVTIFAPSMRGTGEGHYPWSNGQPASGATSMTNGSVASAAPTPSASSMTNGNVASASGTAGGKRIVVTYKGGQQTVAVGPGTPIVSITPADASIITQGAQVLVVAVPSGSGLEASRILVATHGAKLAM